jgi:hypothetical protein
VCLLSAADHTKHILIYNAQNVLTAIPFEKKKRFLLFESKSWTVITTAKSS